MSGSGRVDVAVTDARGRAVPDHGLARWLARVAPARARGRVSIALVSDVTMRRLNREYRGQDHATDVLSFPAGRPSLQARPLRADLKARSRLPESIPGVDAVDCLGDLAIALGVARRQARAQGHDLPTELRILALHGLLHLLGYDHDTDQGRMRRVEERLRRRAGLPSGLIARPAGRPRP